MSFKFLRCCSFKVWEGKSFHVKVMNLFEVGEGADEMRQDREHRRLRRRETRCWFVLFQVKFIAILTHSL